MPPQTDTPLRPPTSAEQLGELFTPIDVLLGLPNLASYRSWPRGVGQCVIVLPGYGGADGSTWALRQALNRCGYRAEGWGLGRNNGDVPELMNTLLPRIRQRSDSLARPVHLVGWSLGGYLAREIARELPDCVAGVVTLGSPVVGGPKYTAVAKYWRSSDKALDEIEQTVEQRYAVPIRCPVVSIYSRRDGVVQWRASIDERSPNVRNIAIGSSHLALGFSGRVIELTIRSISENSARGTAAGNRA